MTKIDVQSFEDPFVVVVGSASAAVRRYILVDAEQLPYLKVQRVDEKTADAAQVYRNPVRLLMLQSAENPLTMCHGNLGSSFRELG